ncbi:Filamin-B [Atta colombica]|uniref:Filamin-B n=1 Tax=Atta colombica TaxID=520822 RepID=A0A195B0H7_9HYME|nr:Filamin-B [Atta colombica]
MNESDKSVKCENSAGEEEEDEMFERELAEDAQWKRIQQNTFTRWANERLKVANKHIGDLECDLSDGLQLVSLIEVLSQKRLPKHNQRPTFRSQKLENVSVALKFLEDEGIRLVNIDSSDIVDCKLKLILGLIWTLILHYSISMPMWEGDDGEDKGATPKQRLMHWIQSKVPDLPISNFTSDWNDGRAVGALVDAVAPGLCPDWRDWNPKDAVQNASEAMGLADDWLNIPQLIKPEEMVNPNIDEMSMMTYLSQYPSAKLKPGAPLRARTNPNRVRAYGPGIEPTGSIVGAPANFTVETFSAGKGNVDVIVDDPKGNKLPVDIRFNKDRNLTYSVSYTPKMEGPHKVKVLFAGREIPKSPYTVNVEGHAGDPSKVTASGPGLQPEGVVVNRPTFFDIFTKDAGRGVPEVIILDPQGNKTTSVKLRQTSPDVWRCEYVSPVTGLHSVNIFFAGKPIPRSPIGVNIAPVSDAKKCRAYGRGLLPTGVRVQDIADFIVLTKDAGEGVPDIRVIGPGGVSQPVQMSKTDAMTYKCHYTPVKEGRHVVMITYGGREISKSPFEVNVGPYKESNIKAFGPGLHTGVVGHPAKFTVNTNECNDNGDGTADVSYLPTAPGQYAVHILCDNEDIPKSPYIATISPKTDFDPEKVEVYGPGIQPEGVAKDEPTNFTIDAREAGQAALEVAIQDALGKEVPLRLGDNRNGTVQAYYTPISSSPHVVMPEGVAKDEPTNFTIDAREAGQAALEVAIQDALGKEVPLRLGDNRNGTVQAYYTPISSSPHVVMVNYGGVATKKSPYRVKIASPLNPAMVSAFGPGLEKGVKSNVPTHFNVDCREAGPGKLDIKMVNPEGRELPISLTDNEDGTYVVDYMPPQPGNYTVNLNYGGLKVPQCPIKVNVQPHVDVSKVKVDGLAPNFRNIFYQGLSSDVLLECEPVRCFIYNGAREFPTVDTHTIRQIGATSIRCSRAVVPSRKHKRLIFKEHAHIRYSCIYETNFLTFVKKKKRKKAFEFSLNHIVLSRFAGLFVNKQTSFTIDTRDITKSKTDDGKVSCIINNPSGGKTEKLIIPQGDGTYCVSYTPFEEGCYTIDILYDNVPIPGSPFSVNVQRASDPSKCRAYGPGLEQGITDKTNYFTVETKGAGNGGLGVSITGDGEVRAEAREKWDGSCDVEYVTRELGDYEINIKFAEQSIPGSPFKIKVISPKKNVIAYGPGLHMVREGVPAKFTVDASKCDKQAPVKVRMSPNLGQEPQIKSKGDGLYEVTYQPPPAGSNVRLDVTFDDDNINGSPFDVKVLPFVEPNKVTLSGPGVAPFCTASFPIDFIVDTSNAGYGDLEVQVVGPDQVPRKVVVQDLGDGKYKATYLPDDCGRYKVNVKYGGKEVPNSPVTVQSTSIGSANNCKIKEGIQHTLAQGEEYCITVDTENAGRGAVTCRIRSTTGSEVVDIDIEDNGDGTVNIYYTVADAGDYTLSIKFGGQPVPDGFYTFTASEEYREHSTHKTQRARKTRQKQNQHVVEQRSTTLQESSTVTTKRSSQQELSKKNFNVIRLNSIPLPLPSGGTVTSEVKMPSGNVDKPVIEDNHDGTVSIKYEPREEGLHEIYVKFNGEHVQGSPYKFHVDSLASGYVTAYGPGLVYGVCGEPGNFTISTKGAGAGGLSLAVEGPSKAEISCHDNKDGTVSVSYLPTAPGEYKITVKFGDKHIRGSPFVAKITGEGRKRNQISVGSSSEVQLPGKVSDADIKSLNASITAPSGLEEPCFLKKMPGSGNMCVSFTPREAGEHIVSVKRMGKHIPNSPFKIDVKDREVGDAKKVKVSGPGLKEGKTHVENKFSIDTRNAGFGGLSLSMEGPSKAEIQCKDNEDGTLNISYKPTEPGYYIMNLKFADHHVEGSPFTVKVSGEGSNRQREKIQRQREAVPITEVGNQCKLTFKMPGITSFDLAATVTSPGGVTEDAEIKEAEDGIYAVAFVPKELGVHTVSVRYKSMHIPGSPFQFTVGPLRDGGAHRVHAGGPGLERGEQGEPCEFNIWTREAGAGTLAVSVEGPSKAQIDFKDRKDGSCYVSYVVSEPGEYRVGIKFNDQHIPDSPHKVYISPAMGDAHKLEVAQFPESGVQPDKPCTFLVRKNGAKGELDGKLVSPSGTQDDCFIQSIDADTYSVRFMPTENGIHQIHLKFNGVHISGSPYRVKVGKVDADPAALHAYGNGLKEIKTGQKTDFIIDTCNAGSGALGVTVDGPSKVAMDCTEVEEGYKVRYTPLVPGDYYISIKYNGYHIVGSPYKVPCTGADLAERGAQETSSIVVETVQKISKSKQTGPVLPLFKSDAGKVTSKGMGLKKAYLGKQNQFTVHAGDAGNNILYVGVYGPKGPCEEVFVKHTGRNNYNVSYLVRERGEYIVIVKWGDDHIPGSPYKVEV